MGQAPPEKQNKCSAITGIEENNAASISKLRNRKRKASHSVVGDEDVLRSPKKNIKKKEFEEQRLRRFRPKAPLCFQTILDRAITQRMFVVGRRDTSTPDEPQQTVDIVGSTGNLYEVVIGRLPTCNCPHALKGNQCKHIIYVLVRTLKTRPDLQYQLAFTTSELKEIFSHAPPIAAEGVEDTGGTRKPIEDDCGICCVEFDPEHEDIVYCKSTCGNNVHKACFEQWAATKARESGGVTCPFCRSPWEVDEGLLPQIKRTGRVNADGYVNVAAQVGLSGHRDCSTYHRPWRFQRGHGNHWDADTEDYYSF